MVVSAQHKNLFDLVTEDRKEEVEEFLKKLGSVSEKQLYKSGSPLGVPQATEFGGKEGVFTGSYAVNPANGDKVPIYAGNFVVADYGSGMVMAVPAHDQRDFEFAKKYDIEIKQVISGEISDERAWTDSGKLMNSGEFGGLDNEEAKEKIAEWLKEKGKADKVVNYKLRDWLVSRQRYWGTPIPVVYCDGCGAVPVPEKDLPIELPKNVKFGEGNPLKTNEDWIKTECPNCGKDARRETDTMDTFVNSSWYFLRYCDVNNDETIFDKEKVKYWMPVDLYVGGAEHACMHLIYSRFYTKFLRDIGMINFDEPALKLFHQGMLNAEGGKKMSKSKGNVVLPEVVSDIYGIDTARYFLCSLASPDKNIDWSENGIQGSLRFIKKIFSIFKNFNEGKDSDKMLEKLNRTIKDVSEFIEGMEYRKASIKLKELFEFIEKQEEVSKDTLGKSLKLLNPFCPHITEELWEKIGNEGFISVAEWPEVDESKLKSEKNQQDLNEKIGSYVSDIVKKYEENNEKKVEKIYVYVLPFEVGKIDEGKLKEILGKKVKIFAVNDKDKYDPNGMAKKAIPGKPGVYLE